MINFKDIKHIHFIGIGGIGNSAIAEILLDKGLKVSGSDIKKSKITDNLQNKGAIIYIGHNSSNIGDSDIVVYSSAINEKNTEYIKAKELELPLYNRAKILGNLMDTYETGIAISGTHGKTTTTSMITTILKNLNLDPTSLIGGNLASIKGNALIGDSELFITESCEYKENFLNLNPLYGIILNIEEDHLDYYDDLEHIINSFIKFSKNIHPDGALIVNNDDYNTKRISQYINTSVITIGINQE
ncbi:MAG: Mur ligase domain-containing protein, partial [Bacillota bacterium]|nr:Mur ligase domain-containing protein [Bacillota bacterium]